MIKNAVANLETQIHAFAAVFQLVHHSERLLVVSEMYKFSERFFAGVTVRRMPQIVPERYGFGQILVEPQSPCYCAGYLADFESVRKSGAVMVALGRKKNLSLMLEPAKSLAVQNPVAVALKIRAEIIRFERLRASFGIFRFSGVFTEIFRFDFMRYVYVTFISVFYIRTPENTSVLIPRKDGAELRTVLSGFLT